MPKKILVKSISASGELLATVSCFAGQVSVFRAATSAGLKPYQRALAGIAARDNLVVAVDGGEYTPAEHSLIGFGDHRLSGPTILRDYLEKSAGLPAEALEGALLSYGLENCASRQLSELSQDEERRVCILEATYHPERALILNEPFETINSQWKERFAELIASFARQRQGLVIVSSLSYRPECWIDNELIQRIQVGDNLQRTIGFGGSGSANNQFMNQLRDSVRQGESVEEPQNSAKNETPLVATGFAAAASLSGGFLLTENPPLSPISETVDPASLAHRTTVGLFGKSALIIGCLGGVVGIGLLALTVADKTIQTEQIAQKAADTKETPPLIAAQEDNDAASHIPSEQTPARVSPVEVVEAPQAQQMILDRYPELIRTSLLSTAAGNIPQNIAVSNNPSLENNPVIQPKTTNIFSMIEQAGSEAPQTSPEQSPPEYNSYVANEEPPDEQERREAIRQKFLEAIRAAAERRQLANSSEE